VEKRKPRQAAQPDDLAAIELRTDKLLMSDRLNQSGWSRSWACNHGARSGMYLDKGPP